MYRDDVQQNAETLEATLSALRYNSLFVFSANIPDGDGSISTNPSLMVRKL